MTVSYSHFPSFEKRRIRVFLHMSFSRMVNTIIGTLRGNARKFSSCFTGFLHTRQTSIIFSFHRSTTVVCHYMK